MTILGTYVKQPAEKESYSIDYADDLIDSDGIASAVVTVEPVDLTIVSSMVVGTRVKVLIEGGTNGVKYKITATATTDDGRILQDEFILKIKDY
ncbi:hypothetical protein [Herminiimonas sp. CN]|uniref:phage fiber-tail adaptor protein n=1 Tax=Herminiimonas sp. CN TaxID=1349818 RepID=UPI0004738493|nr:hypothetical protein [Herminiimonas sp. CN]